jgi:hypothetical protein
MLPSCGVAFVMGSVTWRPAQGHLLVVAVEVYMLSPHDNADSIDISFNAIVSAFINVH